jgi:hypothetical protein
MANHYDGDDREDNIPQPAEDPDTGSTGSTDERSSENRRKGLEKEPDDKLGDPDKG